MTHRQTPSQASVQSLVADVFGGLSREELLMALTLMHQILDADRTGDVERIVTALSKQRRDAADATLAPGKSLNENHVIGTPPQPRNYSHRVARYFFSRLTKIQTRLDTAPRRSHTPNNIGPLSPRELTVLHWMKEGKTNWEIAQILGLSERTVRFHVGGIFEKLDVTSRTQAVARALRAGFIAS